MPLWEHSERQAQLRFLCMCRPCETSYISRNDSCRIARKQIVKSRSLVGGGPFGVGDVRQMPLGKKQFIKKGAKCVNYHAPALRLAVETED